MSEGWIKISRSLLESDIWKSDEPFTVRSAWVDLILLAYYEDRQLITYHGTVVDVKRGSLFTSTLKLAERWHWSRGRVLRYLNLLKKLEMITYSGTADGTLITLVNYDKFQDVRTADGTTGGTANDTTGGTAGGTQIKNKRNKEGKNTRVGARQHRRNPTMAEKMAAIEERRQRLIREEQERLKGEQQNDGD